MQPANLFPNYYPFVFFSSDARLIRFLRRFS